MRTTNYFTDEQVAILQNNPNIAHVSKSRLYYTLAFKQAAVDASKQGKRDIDIFIQAGLPPELMGKNRIHSALRKFRDEAKSPEGLKEPNCPSREAQMAAFAKKELSEKQTKVAIRELQEKVIHLEQMVEFLKKTRFPPK